MKRSIYNQLIKWKKSDSRKPLMLYGARQVGKTYILKEFGNAEFQNLVYINCYKNEDVLAIFEQDVNIERIILALSAISGKHIVPGETLVFFDEVQEIPSVVAALKYFCEDMPSLHVVAAGSLLGVMDLKNTTFPTGKVEIMHMYPMTFIEFLQAIGHESLVDVLRHKEYENVVNSLLSTFTEQLRRYYYVGGMPAAVKSFVEEQNLQKVRSIQKDILTAYNADIAKHAGTDAVKARSIFQSIPSQLARENKKFIFKELRKGARYAEYENAIQWLIDAGLVYKIPRLSKVFLPLKFYVQNEVFKLYLLDIGLLGALSDTPAKDMLVATNVFTEYKGAFTENYVLTQLKTIQDTVVAYYSKENSTMELDFVVQMDGHLLPIEVKAEVNVKSKSLRQFITVDAASQQLHGYRFSMLGFEHQDWMSNIPLCAVDVLSEIVKYYNFS